MACRGGGGGHMSVNYPKCNLSMLVHIYLFILNYIQIQLYL